MTRPVVTWHASPMTQWLTSRQAAEQLGVSVRTLDRLDERGVTKPVKLTPTARRRYDAYQIERLVQEGWTE